MWAFPTPLITEEAGLLEVSMSNTGNEPANVNALDGSFSDPLVDVLNSESSLLGEYPPSDKIVRNLGDLHGVLFPRNPNKDSLLRVSRKVGLQVSGSIGIRWGREISIFAPDIS